MHRSATLWCLVLASLPGSSSWGAPRLDTLLLQAQSKYDRARIEADPEARLDALDEGRKLAEAALKLDPDSPDAILAWCANAGTAAGMRKNLSSLFTVSELEERLTRLRKSHPGYGNAAADRGLGTLYLKAPSVISVGSLERAKTHLRAAYEAFPGDPANQLAWAELQAKLGNKSEALELAKRVETAAALPANELDRRDWLERVKLIREELE